MAVSNVPGVLNPNFPFDVTCAYMTSAECMRSRKDYDEYEGRMQFKSKERTRYGVIVRETCVDPLLCRRCNRDITIIGTTRLDGFTDFGVWIEGGGRFLIRETGEVRVPVYCGECGYLGSRRIVWPAMKLDEATIDPEDDSWNDIFTVDRYTVQYDGDSAVTVECRCPSQSVVKVVVHNGTHDFRAADPRKPYDIEYIKCDVTEESGVSFQKIVQCRCHGPFNLVDAITITPPIQDE